MMVVDLCYIQQVLMATRALQTGEDRRLRNKGISESTPLILPIKHMLSLLFILFLYIYPQR
jgi:hypothetical protein